MIGEFVMTENELVKRSPTPDPVGMGSYTIDSHNVQRYIAPDGSVQNEGDIGVSTRGPYTIARGALLPKKSECENLLVPVCVSSSHIAFGSIRMEPVFMILGQSAATIAALAIDAGTAVQDVTYEQLRPRLLEDGQILEYDGPPTAGAEKGIPADELEGIVVDDREAELTGDWKPSTASDAFVGWSYLHDGDKRDGSARAVFVTTIPAAGPYQVSIIYPENTNRATNVTVRIHHRDGVRETRVNQQAVPPHEELMLPLGTFEFEEGATAKVEISNEATDGHVVIDAIQWKPGY